MKFKMTLNHSHVIFKIDNLPEQEIANIRGDVESGKLVLEPFIKCNETDQWIGAGWIGPSMHAPPFRTIRKIWTR